MLSTRSLYTVICLAFGLFSFSQKIGTANTLDEADEHFDHKNYFMAIPVYKAEIRKNPANSSIKYKLGICFLETKISRSEAVKYLLDYTKDPKCDEDGWIKLGEAYLLNNKIDEAIAAFKKFKTLKPKRADEVSRYLENCENAQALIAKPVNVSFMNLGKEINSDDPDYYPFVSSDETFLAFTSRRKDATGGKKVETDGLRPSDIYFSKVVNSQWTTATNAGRAINTALDEQVVGLKSDGLEMCVYEDHIDKFGDLYLVTRKEITAEFARPKLCDPLINEKFESSGCFNEDGTVMFFARRNKMDETSDLFVCRKLPSGKWALPLRLPDVVNSKYNEDFPYLSPDGKTLYFSSEGHNSMGGYDLFKTIWNKETNTFTPPQNLGYPVNSTDDDRNICVTPDNRVAYISAFRPGGFGDLDIYRIKFNDNEQISKIILGKVFMGDSIASHQPKTYDVSIVATNVQTKDEFPFTPHTKTGKFVISLPPGKYNVVVSSEGFIDHKEDLIISDIGKTETEKNKNFTLKKR